MKTLDAALLWLKASLLLTGRKLRLFTFLLPMLLIALVASLGFSYLSQGMGDKVSSESLQVMRTALHRAAVECYSLEGFYPPDVNYLSNGYGIAVDESQIFIDYTYLGSNLMPGITVLPAMKGVSGDVS